MPDQSLDLAIFSRHLDLDPLRGRRRGLVHCRFHNDPSPSLSVDLDAGVFHCFGCGQQGGIKRFAALVGEAHGSPDNPTTEEDPSPWLIAMRLVKRQAWSRPGVRDMYLAADFIRLERRRIAKIRASATDTEAGWKDLEEAAEAERFVNAVEAEWDALLVGWSP